MKKMPAALLTALACTIASAAHAQCASSAPDRFKLDGALVHDTKTSLTWMRCSVGVIWSEQQGCASTEPDMLNLHDAKAAAADAGKGWRVPAIEELHTLVDRACSAPALDARVFPDMQDLGDGMPYWSTTAAELPMPMTYYVDFQDGRVDAHTRGFPLAVRLVRDSKAK